MAELTTKTAKANIFRNGAEVIRRGRAALEQGLQTLRVQGISGTAQTDTARLYCQEGVSCTNMRFETLHNDEPTEIEELRGKITSLQKQIEVKELQIELWKSNGDFSKRASQPVSEVQEYIENLSDRVAGLNSDIIAIQKEIRQTEKKIEELCSEAYCPVMVVDVSAPAAGEYDFELKYFENAARWRPVYEIHTDGEGPLQMLMRGNISQNTTEDWLGIELSLLSGNPSFAGSLPQLDPLYVDIRQPRPVTFGLAKASRMASNAMMDMTAAEFDMAAEEAAAPMLGMGEAKAMKLMQTEAAEVGQDDTFTEYRLPGIRDIKKGGDGTVADVQTLEIPAEYRIVSVPKLDPSAYLTAVVKPADLPVNTGIDPAIYFKGVYSGRVWLDPDLTKDEIEITLGKEERINISRREVLRHTSNTLLKGTRVTEYGYETRVSNNSSAEAVVTIKDQVPVSRNKDISVDVLEISGAELDEETGLLSRTLTLAAARTEVLKLGYKVSAPKDKSIEEHH